MLVAPEIGALSACELVFLATPHSASLELAPPLVAAGSTVVDLSGAFRLPAAEFSAWYGEEHAAPDLTPAPYGLPELFRDSLAGASLVAVPGCFPTAALLALAPLTGLVDPTSAVIVGMSGTSGAGKGLRDDLHASHAFANVTAYGAPRHRHTGEIARQWAALTGVDCPVTFTPHLVPMSRGLVCTAVANLNEGVGAAEVDASYRDRYDAEPFITVLQDTWPATTHVVGGNSAHVSVVVDDATGRVTASCAIDNLVKGAAGQALQVANLLCGLPEGTGLPVAGMYP